MERRERKREREECATRKEKKTRRKKARRRKSKGKKRKKKKGNKNEDSKSGRRQITYTAAFVGYWIEFWTTLTTPASWIMYSLEWVVAGVAHGKVLTLWPRWIGRSLIIKDKRGLQPRFLRSSLSTYTWFTSTRIDLFWISLKRQ